MHACPNTQQTLTCVFFSILAHQEVKTLWATIDSNKQACVIDSLCHRLQLARGKSKTAWEASTTSKEQACQSGSKLMWEHFCSFCAEALAWLNASQWSMWQASSTAHIHWLAGTPQNPELTLTVYCTHTEPKQPNLLWLLVGRAILAEIDCPLLEIDTGHCQSDQVLRVSCHQR